MASFIEPTLQQLVGKNCRFETTDGSVRTERLVSVVYQQIEVNGETVELPVSLLFDRSGYDGLEMRIAKKITAL